MSSQPRPTQDSAVGGGGATAPKPGQSDFASQVQSQLGQSQAKVQEFIKNSDLTPRNQFVYHAVYAGVVAVLLYLMPSVLLKYNPIMLILRTIVAVPHKTGSYGFYALLAAISGGASYALAGPLWERGVRESFEHVILARAGLAALCLVPCIFRFGNDALLLLGLGELGFAFLLKHTENIQNAAIVEAAKGHAATAQTFVNDKVAQAQGTAKAKTS